MSAAPTRIWICVAGKELPDWIVERVASSDVGANGSFVIDTANGTVTVEPGHAVFEFNGDVYASPPRLVQETLIRAGGLAPPPAKSVKAEPTSARAAINRKAWLGDTPLKLKPVIGTPPAPQFVSVDALKVDDTYQRSIEGGASRTLIRKIAENWDWRLCLPLLVSRRAGQMFVIDGQHRKEAAEARGDIHHLPVVVFDFDDPKAEAELFVQANRSRRAMSKLDDFHAAVIAGDKKAVAINEVVVAAGLRVGRLPGWQSLKAGDVVFVKTIERGLASAGKEMVETVLGMIARAFDGLVLIGVGAVFDGLCTLLQQRGADGRPIDPALMEIVLAEVGLPGWKEATETADTGPERADAMLRALSAAYAEAEAE
ncbi:MAG: DUF6551 family protein [Janthinobacterium lividum]